MSTLGGGGGWGVGANKKKLPLQTESHLHQLLLHSGAAWRAQFKASTREPPGRSSMRSGLSSWMHLSTHSWQTHLAVQQKALLVYVPGGILCQAGDSRTLSAIENNDHQHMPLPQRCIRLVPSIVDMSVFHHSQSRELYTSVHLLTPDNQNNKSQT